MGKIGDFFSNIVDHIDMDMVKTVTDAITTSGASESLRVNVLENTESIPGLTNAAIDRVLNNNIIGTGLSYDTAVARFLMFGFGEVYMADMIYNMTGIEGLPVVKRISNTDKERLLDSIGRDIENVVTGRSVMKSIITNNFIRRISTIKVKDFVNLVITINNNYSSQFKY